MKNNFQVIIVVVFIVAAIFGVLVFSGAIPLGKSSSTDTGTGTVVLWGTVKSEIMASLLDEFNRNDKSYILTYVQKDPGTFDQDLLEALAAGRGPDLFFLPDNLAYHYSNKIYTIPYASYPVSSFKQNFAAAGEVFLTSKGVMALPLSIDPLVLYYNRSILDANNIVYPPTTWDEFLTQVPTLTKKDDANKILKPATALGHFANISHAKDILTTFFMQAGDKIVAENNGSYASVLNKSGNLQSALKFYTDFADPLKAIYSWNRSFPNSRDYFSTDNLAFYFGFGSELGLISSRNPNENFSIAPIPQIKNSSFKLTGAQIEGIAISQFSKNFNTAFIAASDLATGPFAKQFANTLGVAPARRDLLAQAPNDQYSPTLYSSALYAKAWLDPSPKDTDNIFRLLVESILSNSMTPDNALKDASGKLDLLLHK